MQNLKVTMWVWGVALGSLALLPACSLTAKERAQETESLLSAAGFQMKLADSPQRRVNLQQLPPLEMVRKSNEGELFFVYADPKFCKCVFVGNQKAYQEYQKLRVQRQIAEEQQQAAAMNEAAMMNWAMWGPWGPW